MEVIYIENAGLILITPFLPQLFSMLNLYEGETFSDESAAERAVHVLHYVVRPNNEAQEYEFVLNKVLCGLDVAFPMQRDIELDDSEMDVVDGMLRAVIEHWSVIGPTGVEGLRESFLSRAGHLAVADEGWLLRVESNPYDVLMDRITWAYTPVRLPWMKNVLNVDWR